jgi:hypothetical protein
LLDVEKTRPSEEHRYPMLTRRAIFGGGIASLGTIPPVLADHARLVEEWRFFKSHFLSEDGRIIDNRNGGVSHSEGQGWGLLFAAAAQDQASFDLILNWTGRVLRRPHDALHAWRYVPNSDPSVPDLNNAADGDIFIAAALIRAGRVWGRPDHLLTAVAIGRDILRLLVRRVGSFTVLLPGVEGFESKDAIVVNPSYYAFPMITELAGIVPSQQWGRLQRDGQTLIERGRFGRWMLPPDWLRISKVDSSLSPAPGWLPRFSYDALRIPLWWVWQRLPTGPAIEAVRRFWSSFLPNGVPAWANLETDEVAPYPASTGTGGIMRLMGLETGNFDVPSSGGPTAISYYDIALILLSLIAERDMMQR